MVDDACVHVQLCPTLCDPMDCSPPGSSVHGISEAGILEKGAIFFTPGNFLTHISWVYPGLAGGLFIPVPTGNQWLMLMIM